MIKYKYYKKHLVLDFETLGQNVFANPVLECSYVAFDWNRFSSDNPYTLLELVDTVQKDKLNFKYQTENYGCKYLKSDIDWWLNLGETGKKILYPSSEDILPSKFLDNFFRYVEANNIGYWWSRSNSFDPVILHRLCNLEDYTDKYSSLLKYWRVRDTRTFIDAVADFPEDNNFVPINDLVYWEETFVQHDSRFDIAADILRLQTLERLQKNLDAPDR